MEFSSCTASPGPATDPVPGTTTPTFANCSGGAVSGTCTSTSSCTALTAGYQAGNYFGSHAFTIPIWSGINIQARQSYLPLGDAPGYFAGGLWNSRYNFFEWLNGYSTSTVNPLDLTEGINNGATSLNPFTANNFFDLSILLSVYDGLFMPNPECLASTTPACASLFQLIDWMTINHALVCGPGFPCSATTLGYTPPPGTFADLRLVLNRNMHWQDCTTGCQPVTA